METSGSIEESLKKITWTADDGVREVIGVITDFESSVPVRICDLIETE